MIRPRAVVAVLSGLAAVAIAAACRKSEPASAPDDAFAAKRSACAFRAGALPRETLGGIPAALPIRHLLVLMQENRSFDHYLGRHPAARSGAMDGIPPGYVNPDVSGASHAPSRAATSCITPDPPHVWDAMQRAWNGGRVDGFFREAERAQPGSGPTALTFYEPEDLPFYTWLYGAFATSDRFFCSALGPTAPNRRFLVTATSNGVKDRGDRLVGSQRSIFDALTDAGASFRFYNPETYDVPLGPPSSIRDLPALYADLATGDLPTLSFVNAPYVDNEHPPFDIATGERFVRDVVVAFAKSPAWSRSALVVTYDESGGFFDHVPPPEACRPDDLPENADFDRLGFRVPFVIVSPYARRGYVSHRVHSHTSITRLVEVLAGVGALTSRDANSDALLDLFDFDGSPSTPPDPAAIPAAAPSRCATPPDAGAD